MKKYDMFGHEIRLNFDKNGSKYTSAFGGVVSLIIRVMLGSYVFYRCYTMLHRDDNEFEQEKFVLDLS